MLCGLTFPRMTAMERQGKTISVFQYRDYRSFLKEWYEQGRKRSRACSFRALARKGGFHSTNFLFMVMRGERNLSEESVGKVARAINLNRQEEEFFRCLVFFNQASTHEEKDTHFRKLLQCKKYSQLKPIEKKQYQYYSAWYHPVVRELVAARDFDGTPEWIAHRISPPITPAQVVRSIELLQELGLITKNGSVRWTQSSPVISTGAELTSVVVHNYHKNVLSLSHQILDELVMPEREVSSLTLGVSREKVPALREKIRAFRRDVLEMVSGEKEPEEVVLLNLQFYPVTKVTNEQKGTENESIVGS